MHTRTHTMVCVRALKGLCKKSLSRPVGTGAHVPPGEYGGEPIDPETLPTALFDSDRHLGAFLGGLYRHVDAPPLSMPSVGQAPIFDPRRMHAIPSARAKLQAASPRRCSHPSASPRQDASEMPRSSSPRREQAARRARSQGAAQPQPPSAPIRARASLPPGASSTCRSAPSSPRVGRWPVGRAHW